MKTTPRYDLRGGIGKRFTPFSRDRGGDPVAPARKDLMDPVVGLAGTGMLVYDLGGRQPGGLGRLAEMILRGGAEEGPQLHRDESRPRLLRRGGLGEPGQPPLPEFEALVAVFNGFYFGGDPDGGR